MKALLTQPILRPPLDDDASHITKVLSAKRSRQIQVCKRYLFQHANHTNNQLVDRGANGGLAGSDMRVIHKTHRKINISGIDNHEVTGLDVVTAATLLTTSLGKVIGIFNEYAYLGKGSSIHSSGQREWFKTNVDEKSFKVGGTQLITTLDGPLWMDILSLSSSMMVWPIPPPLEDPQIRIWTHIHMSSSHLLMNGTPQSLTMILHTLMDWTPVKSLTNLFMTPCLMPMEISMSASLPTSTSSWMHLQKIVGQISSVLTANLHHSSPQEPDWNALRPFFAWTSPSSIKDTFNVTTRHGTAPHTQDYI